MKKIILGGFMMLSGILSAAVLLAGTMAQASSASDALGLPPFALRRLDTYDILPAFYMFIVIAVIGLVIGCWGLFDEKN